MMSMTNSLLRLRCLTQSGLHEMTDTLFPQRDSRAISVPRDPSAELSPGAVLPVSLLVSSARLLIERHLGLVWVSGEISNFMRAASGHCYFNLKDAQAQVRCVLFRQKAQHVAFALRDGVQVEVRATPSIYEARGEFQLNVDTVRLAGVGALYEKFAQLKAKLEAAGWFAEARKRPLPAVSARHRHRDVDAGRGAARHPDHVAPPLARRTRRPLSDARCKATAPPRKSRGRSARRTRAPKSTC